MEWLYTIPKHAITKGITRKGPLCRAGGLKVLLNMVADSQLATVTGIRQVRPANVIAADHERLVACLYERN